MNYQQRRASVLHSLSKTPLLVPLYNQFQQTSLVAPVFGGLTERDERLFEPHSMFTTSSLVGAIEKNSVLSSKQFRDGLGTSE